MNKENLKDELKPFYEKGDCCSWIVELRKDKYQLQQENKQLKEQLDQSLKDYDEELTKRYKVMHYIEQLPFNDLTPLEVKVIYKILGDKE